MDSCSASRRGGRISSHFTAHAHRFVLAMGALDDIVDDAYYGGMQTVVEALNPGIVSVHGQ